MMPTYWGLPFAVISGEHPTATAYSYQLSDGRFRLLVQLHDPADDSFVKVKIVDFGETPVEIHAERAGSVYDVQCKGVSLVR